MGIETQIINATGKTIVTVNAIPNTDYIFPALLVGATACIAIVTAYFMRSSNNKQDEQLEILDKQNKTTAMLEVFKMLNNDTQKNHEAALIREYRENTLYEGQNVRCPFDVSASIVSATYDQVSLMVKNDWIPKEDCYEMFGKMVILYHHILFEDIENRRTARGEMDYRTFFTKLAIDCYEYWAGKNRLPFDPRTGQVINEFRLQQWKVSLEPQSTNRGAPIK